MLTVFFDQGVPRLLKTISTQVEPSAAAATTATGATGTTATAGTSAPSAAGTTATTDMGKPTLRRET